MIKCFLFKQQQYQILLCRIVKANLTKEEGSKCFLSLEKMTCISNISVQIPLPFLVCFQNKVTSKALALIC